MTGNGTSISILTGRTQVPYSILSCFSMQTGSLAVLAADKDVCVMSAILALHNEYERDVNSNRHSRPKLLFQTLKKLLGY